VQCHDGCNNPKRVLGMNMMNAFFNMVIELAKIFKDQPQVLICIIGLVGIIMIVIIALLVNL
jgi:hypothetical protein